MTDCTIPFNVDYNFVFVTVKRFSIFVPNNWLCKSCMRSVIITLHWKIKLLWATTTWLIMWNFQNLIKSRNFQWTTILYTIFSKARLFKLTRIWLYEQIISMRQKKISHLIEENSWKSETVNQSWNESEKYYRSKNTRFKLNI